MKPFAYHRATSVEDAVTTVAGRPDAVFLAGGTNLVDHMKLGVAEPALVVDVGHLPSTTSSTSTTAPCASAPTSETPTWPRTRSSAAVTRSWPARCWPAPPGSCAISPPRPATCCNAPAASTSRTSPPLQQALPGQGCSALGGYVRYHAILGASPHCVAAHPSDMAVAMTALDAQVVYVDVDGEHRLPLTDFHRLPGDEPDRDTNLPAGALITAVEIPAPPEGARSTYRKVRDRNSYAFALTSVAAELVTEDGTINSARIALGGVAHKPWRAHRAEHALMGQPAREDTFAAAAEQELEQAEPLDGNEFKVELTCRTMVATLLGLMEGHQ